MREAKRVWRTAAEARNEAEDRSPDAKGGAHGQSCDGLWREAPAEADVSCEGYDPRKNQAGECGSHDVEKGLLRGVVLDDERGYDSVGRDE